MPELLKNVLLVYGRKEDEGQLVKAVGDAWHRILALLVRDPDSVMQMSPRQWEEFIAGCYEHDGYRVILTPASGDFGRDVIAEKPGIGSIRVLDDMKRYRPGNLVTAQEVRAFLFVAQADRATTAFMTTTSAFAPTLLEDKFIAPHIASGFLIPRARDKTFAWLREIHSK